MISTLPLTSHSTGTPIQRNAERNIRDSNTERRNQIIPIADYMILYLKVPKNSFKKL
jgi:hypothetical protein